MNCRAVAFLLALLVGSASTGLLRAELEEGKARVVPWSGYWWPHFERRMLGPLQKYDTYTGKSSAAPWESKTFPKDHVYRWEGYCHAWSAACILEKEPTVQRLLQSSSGQ